ncbi:MAG: hypothetical protein M3Q55_14540 [Acidobacteriota bacterium]|nr:hypothetical protein [Acidobacteriota bacterium]
MNERAERAWAQWWLFWRETYAGLIDGEGRVISAAALAFKDGYLTGVRDAQRGSDD